MKIIAVILARGGSKEIPQKNIINVNQRPLIEYVISAAQKSKVQETWVSTDCLNIKQVALNNNVNVLDRPKEYATDFSKSEEALIHFANNINFDVLVFLQPTSPLVSCSDINKGIDMMIEKKYDSVFSAYKEHWLPRWTKKQKPFNWNINQRPMRQEADALFVENGAFYITTHDSLMASKLRYSGKIGIVEMPFSRSFQIDTCDDLSIIERLIQ